MEGLKPWNERNLRKNVGKESFYISKLVFYKRNGYGSSENRALRIKING